MKILSYKQNKKKKREKWRNIAQTKFLLFYKLNNKGNIKIFEFFFIPLLS